MVTASIKWSEGTVSMARKKIHKSFLYEMRFWIRSQKLRRYCFYFHSILCQESLRLSLLKMIHSLRCHLRAKKCLCGFLVLGGYLITNFSETPSDPEPCQCSNRVSVQNRDANIYRSFEHRHPDDSITAYFYLIGGNIFRPMQKI